MTDEEEYSAPKRHKSFGSPKTKLPPVTFELWNETYTAYPEVHGATLLRFSAKIQSEDSGESNTAILGFFKDVLLPDSYVQMEKLWEDPNRVVNIEVLTDIISWLVEEYTDRSTPAS